MSKKAFTLVELMIVIAIIGILAAALFPSMSGYLARSRDTTRMEYARRIVSANDILYTDIGRFANHDTVGENCTGNDTTYNGSVASELATKGYTSKIVVNDAYKNYDKTTGLECGSIIYYRYLGGGYCPGQGPYYYMAILLETLQNKLPDQKFGFVEGCTLDYSSSWKSRSILMDVWTIGKFENSPKN